MSASAPTSPRIALPPVALSMTATALATTLLGTLLYACWFATRNMEGRALLAAALLAPLVTVGPLPRMDDRFFFLADILSLPLTMMRRDSKGLVGGRPAPGRPALALCAFMSRMPELAMAGAVAMIIATFLLLRALVVAHRPIIYA